MREYKNTAFFEKLKNILKLQNQKTEINNQTVLCRKS